MYREHRYSCTIKYTTYENSTELIPVWFRVTARSYSEAIMKAMETFQFETNLSEDRIDIVEIVKIKVLKGQNLLF